LIDCDGEDFLSSTVTAFEESITIYPNPPRDKLFIKVNGLISFQVLVISIDGQIVIKERSPKHIDTSTLEQGTYLLQILDTATGRVATKKLAVLK